MRSSRHLIKTNFTSKSESRAKWLSAIVAALTLPVLRRALKNSKTRSVHSTTQSPHGGDAVDATLYSSTGRRDDAVYERLYGMHPLRLLAISNMS